MNWLTLLENLGEFLYPILRPLLEACIVKLAAEWMSKRAIDPEFRAKSSQVFAQWAEAGTPEKTDEDRFHAAQALRALIVDARTK